MKNTSPVLILSLLALTHAGVGFAQPSVTAVLNGASYGAGLAPGCWASIYGTALAQAAATAQSVPLPTALGDVSVTVGGVPAPLMYVSPTQINALIPFDVTLASGPGTRMVPVVVTTGGVTAAAYNVGLTREAPAIFSLNSQGTGPAIMLNPGFELISRVASGDIVVLYATGLGPVNPAVSSASGAPANGPLSWVVDLPSFYIGERKLDPSAVLFAGLAPGFPGVYQLDLKVPAGLASNRVSIIEGGWQSNVVEAAIAAGQNVANVTGSIVGIFPPSNPGTAPFQIQPIQPIGFSVMLQAAAFKVSFRILPAAQPFTVAAVGEAGSAVISIDPAAGTYTETATAPTAATRAGDFSQAEFSTIYDWAGCTATAVCFPIPANVIPMSRIDPSQIAALNWLPSPNTPVAQSSTGLVHTSGSAVPGSTFSIDGTDPSSANFYGAQFGAWLQLPYGPFPTHNSKLELFVDGQSVATTTVTYPMDHR